jgi:hypothetical protein
VKHPAHPYYDVNGNADINDIGSDIVIHNISILPDVSMAPVAISFACTKINTFSEFSIFFENTIILVNCE